jgi:uncharacterized coiled-coil protein SlyX
MEKRLADQEKQIEHLKTSVSEKEASLKRSENRVVELEKAQQKVSESVGQAQSATASPRTTSSARLIVSYCRPMRAKESVTPEYLFHPHTKKKQKKYWLRKSPKK